MRVKVFLIVLLAILSLALTARPPKSQEKIQADKVAKKVEKARGSAHEAEDEREALRYFQAQVAAYAELHDTQLAKLGARAESVAAQSALARAIAAIRKNAEPGDIFLQEVQPLFRRLIAEQLKGPDAFAARKAILEGNPGEEDSVPVVVRVNAAYPPGSARSTVPPSLLLTLPPLPEALKYRFVGRDLVLVDSVAQLIVDFLPSAAPALPMKALP